MNGVLHVDDVLIFDSISGMNWVKTQVASTRRPSVVSISTGGAYSQAQNDTIGTVRPICFIARHDLLNSFLRDSSLPPAFTSS